MREKNRGFIVLLCHAKVDGYKDREHNSLLPEEACVSLNGYVKETFSIHHFKDDKAVHNA